MDNKRWCREDWQEQDYQEFKAFLEESAEDGYRAFHQKLVPTQKRILGVRSPLLKSLAKEIAKGDWPGFLELAQDDSYEELLIQGHVIAGAKQDLKETLELIRGFIPKMDNWAVCDSFCAGLKKAGKNQAVFWDFLQPYLASSGEFARRFAIVMLMSYFVDREYLAKVLESYDKADKEGYYVKMGVAWGISLVFVRFPEEAMAYLKDNHLDDFTYNKALQKIIESNRVGSETKAEIRAMKRSGKKEETV